MAGTVSECERERERANHTYKYNQIEKKNWNRTQRKIKYSYLVY